MTTPTPRGTAKTLARTLLRYAIGLAVFGAYLAFVFLVIRLVPGEFVAVTLGVLLLGPLAVLALLRANNGRWPRGR